MRRFFYSAAWTGLIGEWLDKTGFPTDEELDRSAGMLAVVSRKGLYAALYRVALRGPLPFADGRFAGVIVLTVKDTIWTDGFDAAVLALEAVGRVVRIHETPPYVSMPGVTGTVPSGDWCCG